MGTERRGQIPQKETEKIWKRMKNTLLILLLIFMGCATRPPMHIPYDIGITRIPSGDFFISTQKYTTILNGTISDSVFENQLVIKMEIENPAPPDEMTFLSDKEQVISEKSFILPIAPSECKNCTISF